MTNASLMTAAALTVGIGIVHSWLGERRIIGPLLSLEMRTGILHSIFVRNVLRFAWHLTSLAWWGFAAILAAMATMPINDAARMVLWIVALIFIATGLTTLVTSRGRHLAWPVFMAIGGLSLAPIL